MQQNASQRTERPHASRTGPEHPTHSPEARGGRRRRCLLLVSALALVGLGACGDETVSGMDADGPDRVAAALVLAGDGGEGVVGRRADDVEVRLVDERGGAVAGVAVRFDVATGGGRTSPSKAVSTADGIARSAWTLGPVAGEQRIEVRLAPGAEVLGEVTVQAQPGPPAQLVVLPEQVTLPAGVAFELEAQVRDGFGNQITSIPVEWGSEDEGIAQVAEDGRVTGLAVGATTVEARPGPDASVSHPDIVEALGQTGPELHHKDGHDGGHSKIDVVEGNGAYVSTALGDGQTGLVGETLAEPIVVEVTDADGEPLRQVDVSWMVQTDGGTVSEAVTRTDGQGRASVEWTLGPVAGTQAVEAAVGDLGAVAFSATAYDDNADDDGSSHDDVDDPGTVTDLAVAGTDTTAATLRFTQVDDGTGSPANYQIRFAVAPIGWGWGDATPVSEGTCAGEVTGTGIDETLTCTVEGLEPGTEYDFQLIAYRGRSSDDTRVYGDLSNVATGATDSASSDDSSSDDGSDGDDDSGDDGSDGDTSGGSFEPVSMPTGFSRIADTNFDEADLDGFVHRATELEADGTASTSCCNVGQKLYAVGDEGGGGVGMHRRIDSEDATKVYAAVWVKFSENFRNHSSQITKIFYVWSAGQPKMILTAYGPDLELRSLLRHAPGGGSYETANRVDRSEATLERGTWHLVEYVVESSSSPGTADGAMRWWLDGTLVGEYTGLATHDSGESLVWDTVEWNTIWGGNGDEVTTEDGDMYMRVSHFYIGGAR